MGFLAWIFGGRRPAERPVAVAAAPDSPEMIVAPSRLQAPMTAAEVRTARKLLKADRLSGARRGEHVFGLVAVENVYCEILYQDAEGAITRRPITLMEVERRDLGYLATAWCHMRCEIRSFYVERMLELTTEDGEVFDGPTFFRQVLGFKIKDRLERVPRGGIVGAVREVRAALHAPITLLVCCARSDGEFHEAEMDRILQYARAESVYLFRAGHLPCTLTEAMKPALAKTIASMRPQARTLTEHMFTVLAEEEPTRERFKAALIGVAMADGVFGLHEREFLQEFDNLARLALTDPASLVEQVDAAVRAVG